MGLSKLHGPAFVEAFDFLVPWLGMWETTPLCTRLHSPQGVLCSEQGGAS